MKLEERLMKTVLEQVAKRAAEQQLNEEQINELIETAIKAMTTDGLEKASGFLADTLRQQIPEMIAQENTMQTGFEQRLYERWKKALDLYDAIVILTRECVFLIMQKCTTLPQTITEFVPTPQKSVNRNR